MLTTNKSKQKLMAAMRELAKAQERAYEALYTDENYLESAAYLYEAEQHAETARALLKEIREMIVH